MKVIVMGQGYVGLRLAVDAAEAGHEVIGYEPDEQRRQMLENALSPLTSVTDERIRQCLDNETYCPTRAPMALKGFDVAVITVPVPTKDRIQGPSYVSEAAATLAAHLTEGALVVLESTTYPGTTRDTVIPVLEQGSGLTVGEDFHVAFSAERIRDDQASTTIGGYNMTCRQVATLFYKSVMNHVALAESLEEAETVSMRGDRP